MTRSVHLVLSTVATAIAVAVVVTALIAARLSAGPMSVGFLAPLLERAIDPALAPLRVRTRDIELTWRDWTEGLVVRLVDVTLADGQRYLGRIDTLGVAFGPAQLARGVFAPTSIEVTGGELVLPRGPDGRWLLPEPGPAPADDAAREGPLARLGEVRIDDVRLVLQTGGATAPVEIAVERLRIARGTPGLGGTAVLSLRRGAELARVVAGAVPGTDDTLQTTVRLSGLRPAAYADLDPMAAPLSLLDLPLGGTAIVRTRADGAFLTADASLSGEGGALVVDRSLAARTGLDLAPQRLPVQSLAVDVGYDASGAKPSATLRGLDVAFDRGATVRPPPPVDISYPLASLGASATWDGNGLRVNRASIDLGDTRFEATASLDEVPQSPRGTIEVVGTGIRVDDFSRYWPPSLAPGGYRWCVERLSRGVVPQARLTLAVGPIEGDLGVTALDLRVPVENLVVDYLPPMPPVRDVRGTVRFDLTSMRITLLDGDAEGVRVTGGSVVIPDLTADPPSIDIDVRLEGPVRSAMTIIAQPPLEYTDKIGIDPDQTSGRVAGAVRLQFPLLADLEAEEMGVDVDLQLTDVGIDDLVGDVDVRDGDLRLGVTQSGMRLDGTLAVAGVEGRLSVAESFVPDSPDRTRIEFASGEVAVERLRRALPDVEMFDEYVLGGSLAGEIGVEIDEDGRGRITGTLDLRRAALRIPDLGWSKDAGTPGSLAVTVETDGRRIRAVPDVVVSGPDLDARGSLALDSEGELLAMYVARLATGRTDVAGTLSRLADGRWDITLAGRSVDLRPMLAGTGRRQAGERSESAALPGFTLTADVDELWFADDDPIRAVAATIVRENDRWELVQMQGSLVDQSVVELTIVPDDARSRTFTLDATDAGEALRAFRIFSDMRGGTLQGRGRFDDTDPLSPLTGDLRVRDFHIVRAPVLARLLSVLALTGVRDALAGRGIFFSTLDLPFRERGGIVEILDGRTNGFALGMTFAGVVDSRTETIDLGGELVPFYAVNSALGLVPFIGDALTGGVAGGGVFSASYRISGPLSDPNIDVNPVSVLFPSFLRFLLETVQGWLACGVGPDQAEAAATDPSGR